MLFGHVVALALRTVTSQAIGASLTKPPQELQDSFVRELNLPATINVKDQKSAPWYIYTDTYTLLVSAAADTSAAAAAADDIHEVSQYMNCSITNLSSWLSTYYYCYYYFIVGTADYYCRDSDLSTDLSTGRVPGLWRSPAHDSL